MDDLAAAAEHLAREITGCRLADAQSDEISLVLTDFATPTPDAWFDGNQWLTTRIGPPRWSTP